MDGITRLIEEPNGNLMARKRPKGGRAHELGGMLGHDDLDILTGLLKQPQYLARLVGRNATRDA